VLAAAIIGSSLAFIDGTVVNVALPAIQRDLQADEFEAQWVVESYALFLAALLLVGGSLGDHFSRRMMFAVGVVLFAAASVAIAPRPSGCATGHPSPPGALAGSRRLIPFAATVLRSLALLRYRSRASSHNDLTPLQGYRGLLASVFDLPWLFVGICLGEGDPDLAHTESNLGPDLEEIQADRAAVRRAGSQGSRPNTMSLTVPLSSSTRCTDAAAPTSVPSISLQMIAWAGTAATWPAAPWRSARTLGSAVVPCLRASSLPVRRAVPRRDNACPPRGSRTRNSTSPGRSARSRVRRRPVVPAPCTQSAVGDPWRHFSQGARYQFLPSAAPTQTG
jgi:MFS family permease